MRMRKMWVLLCGVLACSAAAAEGPLRQARSENGNFELHILPGRDGRRATPCNATLSVRRSARSGREQVWQRPLVNDVAPVRAYIRDDGRFLITLDEFERDGARNALVIYDAEGRLVRHFVLSDLLGAEDWPHVKVGTRRLGWLYGAQGAFEDDGRVFAIQLTWGRKVRIDLERLQVVRPDAAAAGDGLAIPADVLAALLGADFQPDPNAPVLAADPNAPVVADVATDAAAELAGELTAEELPLEDPNAVELAAQAGTLDLSGDAAAGTAIETDEPAVEDTPAEPEFAADGTPRPNPARPIDYLAWINTQTQVASGDGRPMYDAATEDVIGWAGDAETLTAAVEGDAAALTSNEMIRWLAQNSKALDEFSAASRMAGYSGDYHSEDGTLVGVLLPALSPLRTLAKADVVEGRLAATAGRPVDAAEHYLDTLAAGAHVGAGHTLIEQLVGAAMQAPAADAVLDLLASPDADVLNLPEFAATLESAYPAARPSAVSLEGERAFFYDTVQRLWKPDASGQLVVDEAAVEKIYESVGGDASGAQYGEFLAGIESGQYADTVAAGDRIYDAYANAMQQDYSTAKGELAQVESDIESLGRENAVVRALMPALSRYHFVNTRSEMIRRGTLLTARLQAYHQQTGTYPENLDAFGGADYTVDPFSGGRFRYAVDENGFTLYSVGGDGVDDGGAHDRKGERGDYRLWPRPAGQ